MLTPQDIAEKRFVKAVFGGYDMPGVDEFLEAISTDYNALYKENAKLKGKLKVLVEKVEEYRSTEDAMRMALLTAQRMGEEITIEATRTKEEILKNAQEEVQAKLTETTKKIAQEEARLAAASKETTKFLELSQAIMRKHSDFLKKLEAANPVVKTTRSPAKTAKQETIPEPTPHPPAEAPAPAMPTPAPMPIQAPLPVQTPSEQTAGFELDNIAQEIGNAVEQMTGETASEDDNVKRQETPVKLQSPDSLYEPVSDTKELPDADEVASDISPRPKFDFDDLKFGANFDNDD